MVGDTTESGGRRIAEKLAEGALSRLTPLVDHLARFCRGHDRADGGGASLAMLAALDEIWPDVPKVSVRSDPGDERGAEELVLAIIGDVGDLAWILGCGVDPAAELAWARANLIFDLERYRIVVGGQTREP